MPSLRSNLLIAIALCGLAAQIPQLASADGLPDMSAPRVFHAATKLPDGTLLITGGRDGSTTKASAEMFYPASNAFVPLSAEMTTERAFHTATVLENGKVLIAGGFRTIPASGAVDLNSAEIFDPATLQFSPTSLLSTTRSGHSATLLPDGRVFMFGGTADLQKAAELFDPAAQTFEIIPYPGNVSRTRHTATLLPNGKVLLAGGRSLSPVNTAELFDPATGTFSATANMNAMRVGHTATLLPDGRVLVAGGIMAATNGQISYHRSLELYDSATNSFALLPTAMALPRDSHTATLVPAMNAVVIAGGEFGKDMTNAAEVFDCATWSLKLLKPATMRGIRAAHTATLLAASKVILVGGFRSIALSAAATAELIDVSSVSEAPRPAITSFEVSRGGAVWMVGTAVPNYLVRIQTANSPSAEFAEVVWGASELQCDTNGVFSWYAPLFGGVQAPRFFRAVIP